MGREKWGQLSGQLSKLPRVFYQGNFLGGGWFLV